MAKTRGAHSFLPRVRQGPTPPARTSTPGADVAVGPSSATGPSSPAVGISPAATSTAGPVRPPHALQLPLLPPLPLLMLRAPPLWPLPRGDIIPGLAPLCLLRRIPGQPGGPHRPRGPGLQAQRSHPLRDTRRHPHRLIRALPEPRTYTLHPSSGDLTSLAAPSRGMLTA